MRICPYLPKLLTFLVIAARAVRGLTYILLLLVLTLLIGCSKNSDLPGYSLLSGELGGFVLQHASLLGARARQTNGLPQFATDWYYKEDADGFQVYLVGNRLSELHSFLIVAFGPPANPPSTNELETAKSVSAHYGPNLGAVLVYGLQTTPDGKQFTSLVVVRTSAFK